MHTWPSTMKLKVAGGSSLEAQPVLRVFQGLPGGADGEWLVAAGAGGRGVAFHTSCQRTVPLMNAGLAAFGAGLPRAWGRPGYVGGFVAATVRRPKGRWHGRYAVPYPGDCVFFGASLAKCVDEILHDASLEKLRRVLAGGRSAQIKRLRALFDSVLH